MVSSSIAEAAFARLQHAKRTRSLPGTSSTAMNRAIWNHWDWTAGGEEWKESLVRCVLRRYIPSGVNVLEIGPSAGRWTEILQKDAVHLTSVDISETCVNLCREKFREAHNCTFLVTQGSDVAGVADQSIDAIWSFDVFVHINQAEVTNYVKEFRRVLRPGGSGVIHHGKFAGAEGGWRSDLTTEPEFEEHRHTARR
jgi:ubiquinone/menaquinone biosynthesis C-methylase UbiE